MNSRLIPKSIRDDMTKALGFLHRDSPEKAISYMVSALRALSGESDQIRLAMADRVIFFLDEFVRHPRVSLLLAESVPRETTPFPYKVGHEGALAVVLDGFCDILREQRHIAQEAVHESTRHERKRKLWDMALFHLKSGATSLAEAYFLRFLEEYPDEEDRALEAAKLLRSSDRELAAHFYDELIAVCPRVSKAYSEAIELAVERKAYAEAESLYLQAFRVFGLHPKTLVHMANLYRIWGKREEAHERIQQALSLDPHCREAEAFLENMQDDQVSESVSS
ncbi:MAG: hypothetical protein K5657_00840 [Desulfovibrio sp.]|nr:hypothetical protein [Desulfovibrio sp.]